MQTEKRGDKYQRSEERKKVPKCNLCSRREEKENGTERGRAPVAGLLQLALNGA